VGWRSRGRAAARSAQLGFGSVLRAAPARVLGGQSKTHPAGTLSSEGSGGGGGLLAAWRAGWLPVSAGMKGKSHIRKKCVLIS